MKRNILSMFFAAAMVAATAAAAAAYTLVPEPQKKLFEGRPLPVNPSTAALTMESGDIDPRVLGALKEVFPNLETREKPAPGGVYIHVADQRDEHVNFNCPEMFCASLAPSAFGPQEYFLGVKRIRDYIAIQILYKKSEIDNGVGDSYGAYYAARTLKQLYTNGTLPEIAIHDWPEFEIRGILEGFYGKPWPDDGRVDIIDWMSDYKYNIFLYTPKDDHKLRFGWRLRLTDKELAGVKELNDLASENYVRYCWSLSPGVSVNFSSQKDMKKAYLKFRSVIEQGVKCFSLAFDDVGKALTPYDRDNFETYEEGQVFFTNKVLGKLMDDYPDVVFAFVPNDYWGELAMESEYLRYIGENLDPRLRIGWTGMEIAPDVITAEDATFYERFIKRKPFLGDNFPVLDNIDRVGGRLALGPLRGRDPRLFHTTSGFAANAMPLPLSSKPAFISISDFTWNPVNYDADRSWVNTARRIAGEDRFDTFHFFAKQSQSSLIWKYDAMDLHEETRAVLRAFQDIPNYKLETAAPALRSTLERFQGMDVEMQAIRTPENSKMLDEMQPWVDKLVMYGSVGEKTLDLLLQKYNEDEAFDPAKVDEVEKEWLEGEKNTAVITKMVMHNFMLKSLALLRGEELPEDEKLDSIFGE